MKLIIREYLASLRERGELDVVLPDLLSQLGLTVFSRPSRGTRQDGVDVAAVGAMDGQEERVFLLSIKPGDLSRRDWNGDSAQALRPSLHEIVDSYIPNRLPPEHRDKHIVICVVLGGDVHETVRPLLSGFIQQNTRQGLSFEEWNGDKLANLIQSSFLREDILPGDARSLFRKSLAMIDEPNISFQNFSELVEKLASSQDTDDRQCVTAMRQIAICLWIMFAWAREAENMESAYLSGERALLHGWHVVRGLGERPPRVREQVAGAFNSIFTAYSHISTEYLTKNVVARANQLHALSAAVAGSSAVDISLRMFEVLGRLSNAGLWAVWRASKEPEGSTERADALIEVGSISALIMSVIENNPALILPIKDDQAIDVSLALTLMAFGSSNHDYMRGWLDEMMGRAAFTLDTNGAYPSVLDRYDLLLRHPQSKDDEYKKNATRASILYPIVALWACLLEAEEIFAGVSTIQSSKLAHSTFQLWFPDASSESHLYKNDQPHGSVLADLSLRTRPEYLETIRRDVVSSMRIEDLSAVRDGWWPIVAVACRHHRVPVPVQLFRGVDVPQDPAAEQIGTPS